MKRLHIDFAEIEGWEVLVIIDVHSKWIKAVPLRKATAATTVSALHTFFLTLGYLKSLCPIMGPSLEHKSSQTCERSKESSTCSLCLTTLLQMGQLSVLCR